jgi:hypothetical protein
MSHRLTWSLSLLLLFAIQGDAKSWRGIEPLRSTRSDVERLLGKPSETTDKSLTYRFPSETVFVSLITTKAEYVSLTNLPRGTVKDIQVIPKDPVRVADLGLDENRIVFIKGSRPEYLGFQGYIDLDAGLIVQTSGPNVERIFYFGNAKDRASCPNCSIEPQALADVPICVLCPTVSLTCPDQVEAGTPAMFTSNVAMGYPAPRLSYSWTITAGTIIEGRETESIKVDTKNLAGKTLNATVDVGGIDPACARTASCAVQIIPRKN